MMLSIGDRVEHNTFPVFIGNVAYIESNIDIDRVGVVSEDNGTVFWDSVDTWDVLYESNISYTSMRDDYSGATIDVDAVIDIQMIGADIGVDDADRIVSQVPAFGRDEKLLGKHFLNLVNMDIFAVMMFAGGIYSVKVKDALPYRIDLLLNQHSAVGDMRGAVRIPLDGYFLIPADCRDGAQFDERRAV